MVWSIRPVNLYRLIVLLALGITVLSASSVLMASGYLNRAKVDMIRMALLGGPTENERPLCKRPSRTCNKCCSGSHLTCEYVSVWLKPG